MPSGIRTAIKFSDPNTCPLIEISSTKGARINQAAVSICSEGCNECVVDINSDTQVNPNNEIEMKELFSVGDTHRYRIRHDTKSKCPCVVLGQHGCPIDRYTANNGELEMVFHVSNYDELRETIRDLRDEFPDIDITRFVKSPDTRTAGDHVSVDRSRLTPKQLEALTTAYEMGYFDRPRKTNNSEVANQLNVSSSTFAEHISAAHKKILDEVLR